MRKTEKKMVRNQHANWMKKVTSCTASAAMALALGVSAMASEPITITELGADHAVSKDVTVTYESAANIEKVYSVDIVWGDLAFTYTESGDNKWNPDTHLYGTNSNGTWKTKTTGGDLVTVKNNSNANVNVEFAYQQATTNGVKGSIAVEGTNGLNETILQRAVYNDTSEAGTPSATAKMTLSGRPLNTIANGATVGSVTVTLTPDVTDGSVTRK